MKLAVSMYSFRRYNREFTHAEAVAFCRRDGVGLEVLNNYLTGKRSELRTLRRMLDNAGVPLAAFSASNDFALRNAAHRREQLDGLRRCIDRANELQADIVRVFMGDEKENARFSVRDAAGWICDGLADAAEYAGASGTPLVLGVENHGKLLGRSRQVRQIIRTVNHPRLRATLDVGNFLCVDEDPWTGFTTLLPHMAHIHLKDFKRLPDYAQGCSVGAGRKIKGAILGEGIVPLSGIFRELRARGYTGFMSLEFEGWEDYTYGLRKGLENARAMLAGLS